METETSSADYNEAFTGSSPAGREDLHRQVSGPSPPQSNNVIFVWNDNFIINIFDRELQIYEYHL